MTTKTSLILAALSMTLGACSTAHLVRQTTLGGQVQLQGAYMPAMSEARLVMAEHCQGHFNYRELGQNDLDFVCEESGGESAAIAGLTMAKHW